MREDGRQRAATAERQAEHDESEHGESEHGESKHDESKHDKSEHDESERQKRDPAVPEQKTGGTRLSGFRACHGRPRLPVATAKLNGWTVTTSSCCATGSTAPATTRARDRTGATPDRSAGRWTDRRSTSRPDAGRGRRRRRAAHRAEAVLDDPQGRNGAAVRPVSG
ncbi:hypothetical protein [Streptomyces sp. NPDC006134]|uniref:hypothetical protein n=1 Tax=Streptomyces sp. NPDC006134 TaxID=3154467 RepID=UPI0033D7DFE9